MSLGALLGAAVGLLASCLTGPDLVVTTADAVQVYGSPGGGELLLHAVAEGENTGQVRVLADDGRVLAELTGVRYSPAPATVPDEVRQRVAERLYTVRWQRAELPAAAAAAAATAGRWLVAAARPADSATVGGLAAALTGAGADARAVDGTPDWAGLLAGGGVAGIVLAATAPTAQDEPAGAAAEAALAAAQAVAGAAEPSRLWLVTRGAQDPGGTTAPDRGQAAAWGLARVLAMEAPDAWGGALDLGALTERDYADAAAVLLARATGDRPVEDELALRDGAVHVPRLVRAGAPPEALPPLRCHRDGWYVVAGALTAAVRPVIDRLVAAGARRLLVVRPAGTGSSAPEPDAGWAEEMSLAGADLKVVDLAPVDLARAADGSRGPARPRGAGALTDPAGPRSVTLLRLLADATGGEPVAGVVLAPAAPAVVPLTGVQDRAAGRGAGARRCGGAAGERIARRAAGLLLCARLGRRVLGGGRDGSGGRPGRCAERGGGGPQDGRPRRGGAAVDAAGGHRGTGPAGPADDGEQRTHRADR